MLLEHEIPLSSARAALPAPGRAHLSGSGTFRPSRPGGAAPYLSHVGHDHSHDHGPGPLARDLGGRRREAARRGARADPRLHDRRGGGRHRRRLAGAALGRRPHAHRRRRDRAGAGRASPRAAPRERQLHLRPAPGRDPLGRDQRSHAAAARRLHRLRGSPAADRPARGRGRVGPDRGADRHPGEPAGAAADRERRAAQPQRRGRLPAHPHRPVRVRRDGDRRRADPDRRLRARRRDRLAAGRGDDAVGVLRAASRLGPRLHGGGARRASTPARSGARSPASPGWSRSTTSTSGR